MVHDSDEQAYEGNTEHRRVMVPVYAMPRGQTGKECDERGAHEEGQAPTRPGKGCEGASAEPKVL